MLVCKQNEFQVISAYYSGWRQRLSCLRQVYQQKETLVSIAKEGKASGVTSVAYVKKHALKSPSSVQYAISALLDKQLLTYQSVERTKVYSISDKFLEMWICRTY